MTRRFRPGQAPVGWTGLIHHFGAIKQHLRAGGVPVIVEGPMDAIAVTLASGGRYIGVAPLGTSLTDEQVGRLARVGNNPIVATDADIAGGSQPNATSGCSPPIASTRDTPGSRRAVTRLTCSRFAAPTRSPPSWSRRDR
jgi:Toprim-like